MTLSMPREKKGMGGGCSFVNVMRIKSLFIEAHKFRKKEENIKYVTSLFDVFLYWH